MTILFLLLFFGSLILLAFPIATAILISTASIPLFSGCDTPLLWRELSSQAFHGAVDNNVGLTIVLFMIAGEFMAKGKLTEKNFHTFAYFCGKRTGFMPIASIITCMFYGAISGSGPATTAAVGAMCYPMLVGMGYDKFFSASILVSAGCLGMVIPPSVPLTGAAGLAGGLELVPLYQIAAVSGVSAGLLLIIYTYLHCRIRGDGDRAVIHQSVDELRQQSFRLVFKDSIWALMTPVLILGTIFSGIADTAQAAVVSLAYSILVAVFVYRTIRPEEILPLLRQCILSAAPLCFLIALSNVFSAGMSALDIPARLANALIHSGVSSRVLILLVLGCMLLLGAFMDCGAPLLIIPISHGHNFDTTVCYPGLERGEMPWNTFCLWRTSPACGASSGTTSRPTVWDATWPEMERRPLICCRTTTMTPSSWTFSCQTWTALGCAGQCGKKARCPFSFSPPWVERKICSGAMLWDVTIT